MDGRLRSVIKAVTFRIIGVLVLATVAWFVTGNVVKTTMIALMYHVIQTVVYYLHERLWVKIKWGKNENVPTELR